MCPLVHDHHIHATEEAAHEDHQGDALEGEIHRVLEVERLIIEHCDNA